MQKPVLKTLALALLTLSAGGCDEKPQPPRPSARPAASVTLRVAVAEDAALAEAIRRLRGEWSERSGGELVVDDLPLDQLLSPTNEGESPPEADLLIFPSRRLGELCESNRLRPMRESTLANEDLRVTDFYPVVRERLMVFGGQTMALPVGCVAPVLHVTGGDTAPGEPEPLTWDRLKSARVGLRGGVEAIQATLLIASAASYADQTASRALLFDPETLAPRLTTPPFVRALRGGIEQAAAAADADQQAIGVDFVWPSRPQEQTTPLPPGGRVVPLPGTGEVYNPIAKEWKKAVGAPQRVTLLATSGRLVGVTTASRNAASAFRLAAWLVGLQNSRQLATASPNVANPRRSLARLADDWTGQGDKELGEQFAAAVEQSMNGRHAVLIPRILRVDDYLAALDAEVQRAITGEATPQAALAAANDAWQQLTDEIGRDRQRLAYRRHLGLEDYTPPTR